MDIDPYVYQDKSIWVLNWKNTILGILFWPLFIIMIIGGWFYIISLQIMKYLEQLSECFKNTSKEQQEEDFEKLQKYNKIGLSVDEFFVVKERYEKEDKIMRELKSLYRIREDDSVHAATVSSISLNSSSKRSSVIFNPRIEVSPELSNQILDVIEQRIKFLENEFKSIK